MIKIENMRRNNRGGAAIFDAHFDDGWIVRNCAVIERPDGSLAALPPLVREGIRSVQIPNQHWFDFITKALDAYAAFDGEPEDAGLRRVLGAENETLARAGI